MSDRRDPGSVRVERDLIGERQIPADALYGIHTLRAVENFSRPGAALLRDIPEFCRALGLVKLAASRANRKAGEVRAPLAAALTVACEELAAGSTELRDALIVPVIQGGAGTSTNMNVNEVLANRTLDLLGKPRGAYGHCHPNDHVNRSQSTNDVYPTALRVALIERDENLETQLRLLETALLDAAQRYLRDEKLGRTQLQDAVPMTVADEMQAWADALASARSQLQRARDGLLVVNLGGTAIGTGLAASDSYRSSVVPLLAQASELPMRAARRPVSATVDSVPLLTYSGSLRSSAIALAKLANDLRLLSSGPRAGLAELSLPTVQVGSSMMPGKINPVVPEFANQLAFRVRGADTVVAAALDAAQLQLHAMLPAVAAALFEAQDDLTSGVEAMAQRCIAGVEIDTDRTSSYARQGLDGLTQLAATAGYAAATQAALVGTATPAA